MERERCFACDKPLGENPHLVDTRDCQTVYVGSECFKQISKAGNDGYQPPKGGPRLYLFRSYTEASDAYARANAYKLQGALLKEHQEGECYCLNPEESLGRNPCGWCKTEAILNKASLAKSQEGK